MLGGIVTWLLLLSTPEYPKQFIDVLECGRTLKRLTVDIFNVGCSYGNLQLLQIYKRYIYITLIPKILIL